jgi:hypothetical protein
VAIKHVVDTILALLSKSAESYQGGIKRLLVLEHAKGDVDEFTHHGTDGCHFAFAGGAESLGKVA